MARQEVDDSETGKKLTVSAPYFSSLESDRVYLRAGAVRQIHSDGTMNNKDPLVVDVTDAAHRLGLSKSALAKMRLAGTGPKYCKLGRRVGYRLVDLEDWIEQNRFQSTSEYSKSAVETTDLETEHDA